MRKHLLVALIAAICITVMACGGGTPVGNTGTSGTGGGNNAAADNNTAEGLVKVMTSAFADMDAGRVSSYFVPEERDAMKTKFEDDFKKMKNDGAVKIVAKFSNLKTNGDNATADMALTPTVENGTEKPVINQSVSMVKKDGKWWCKK